MAMPIDLVFVRHGQSEQNLASQHARQGDNSLYTKEFKSRPGSQHRLTKLGRQQAKAAGEWLRKHDLGRFDRRYVSDYVRAKETAGLLAIDGPGWYVDHMLREREWGDHDGTSWEERQEAQKNSLINKDTDPFYWIPPNGESMAQLTVRLKRLFDTLYRECSDMRVVVVCHGEVMESMRQIVERMPLEQWLAIERSDKDFDRIHNCQVLHYTRRDPETSELATHLNWMRSVCPWDGTKSSNKWQRVERKRFTNQELLDVAEKTKPLFANLN